MHITAARPYTVCARVEVPLGRGRWGGLTAYPGDFTTTKSQDFLSKALGVAPRLEVMSRDWIVLPTYVELVPTSLLAQTIHTCFNQHIGLSLAPEVLWYAILSQFATDVKQNPEVYRDLFTSSAVQETIMVHHDGLVLNPASWYEAIAMFDPELRARIPSKQVMLPRSTRHSQFVWRAGLIFATSPRSKRKLWHRR